MVGADRIAANGDTANKIGTFSLAVAAHHHNIPFFIAAPTSTIDPQLAEGSLIPIEQRSPEEVGRLPLGRCFALCGICFRLLFVLGRSLSSAILGDPYGVIQCPAWYLPCTRARG